MSILRNESEPKSNGLIIQSTYGFHEIVDRLRNTTLKNNPIPNFHPYWRSKITLEEVKIEDLHPCALYVVKDNLSRVRELGDAFSNYSIDPFRMRLNKALVIYTWKGREDCIITPPLIEVSEDDGGIMVVTDGLHRVVKAKEDSLKSILVTKVQNIAIPLPVLPVEWDEVRVVDEVPPMEQKRRYRFNEMYEIKNWVKSNWERFAQGLDLGDSMMRRILERQQIMETYSNSYAPWDCPG